MPVISEGNNLGDLLKYEEVQFFSRDTVTVASGQNLSLGTVVGIKSADGKVHALNPTIDPADGTQIAAGVLILSVNATAADVPALIVARHAIVSDTSLVWPEGITTNQKSTAVAQLKALGILIRKGV